MRNKSAAVPDNVTSIFGQGVPKPGEPVEEIVQKLSDLLEKAKAGELRAIGLVHVRGNGRPSIYFRDDPNVDSSIFVLHSGGHCLVDMIMESMAIRSTQRQQEDDGEDDDCS